MAKIRTLIPDETADALMFASDRTCCVCEIRGRPLQIHHIDENPSNNEIDNLSVLCFECHNETQIKGGFGRKLSKGQVIRYRNDWHRRVQKRRDDADELIIKHKVVSAVRMRDVEQEDDA